MAPPFASAAFQEGIDYFLKVGAIDRPQAHVLLTEHQKTGKGLEELCVDFHFLSAQTMAPLLAALRGYPDINLAEMVLDARLIQTIPREFCMQHALIPLCVEGGEVWIAMADVDDLLARDQVPPFFPGKKLKIFWAPRCDILDAIGRYEGFETTLEGLLEEMEKTPPHAAQVDSWVHPAVRFVQALLFDGVQKGASDIHCEPEKSFMRIRYRCDGLLKTVFVLHVAHWPPLLNRLKIISHMDISETRKPQNGRMTSHILGRPVDFRLACHPTCHGESLVIRILSRGPSSHTLPELGYASATVAHIERCLRTPHGLTVVTGPTGTGKTTSLYAFLQHLDVEQRKIMTLEEPVEYHMPFISQTDIHESIGLTFANGVKSILRQDPDVIFIGEIRDADTAYMALRAAMTGHQVLTTLHTQDALSGVYRLFELGVKPAFLAGHLNGLIAQRLLRKLCVACKKVTSPPEGVSLSAPVSVFEAQGCPDCGGTGYKGRFPVAEVILFDEELHGWLIEGAPRSLVPALLKKQGFRRFWEEGMAAVIRGVTDLKEVERVLGVPLGLSRFAHRPVRSR